VRTVTCSRPKYDTLEIVMAMLYDRENRLNRHEQAASIATYTYAADGLKRLELVDGVFTTLVWDGDDYLKART
jgi:hypothetical protein